MIIDDNRLIVSLIGIISSVFWYLLKSRDKREDAIHQRLSDFAAQLDDVRLNYQRHDFARHDFALMMTLLADIKKQVSELNDKLDRKVDK